MLNFNTSKVVYCAFYLEGVKFYGLSIFGDVLMDTHKYCNCASKQLNKQQESRYNLKRINMALT